ncbi:MAG: hypothetical protein R2748_03215 [Bryobacterales bacterium]
MPAKVYATDWVYLLIQLSIVLIAIPVVFLYLPFFRQTNLTAAYSTSNAASTYPSACSRARRSFVPDWAHVDRAVPAKQLRSQR